MVKGISRQVIVVQSPDQKLFDQAIFILRNEAIQGGGVTDEALVKEAQRLMNSASGKDKRHLRYYGPAWATAGAVLTALVWLATSVL